QRNADHGSLRKSLLGQPPRLAGLGDPFTDAARLIVFHFYATRSPPVQLVTRVRPPVSAGHDCRRGIVPVAATARVHGGTSSPGRSSSSPHWRAAVESTW